MKKKFSILLCVFLALLMVLSITGCSRYAKYELKPAGVVITDPGPDPGPNDIPTQLTEEDIQSMNNGNAYIVYGDPDENGNRYVTFINGKYYDGKVEDQEDAVDALLGIASLMGLGKGSEFFANFGERDSNGYTYWVLQQKYGSSTVQYGTIRVVVDPDGYVCGLSSSVTPNLGIANSSEGVGIDAAMELVEEYMEDQFSGISYKVYEDSTHDVVAINPLDDCYYHSYAIYTSNPEVQQNSTFDMPYLQHIISYEGDYMCCNPTSTMAPGETAEAYNTDIYFENLEGDFWEGDVTMSNGSVRHLKVPVAKSTVDGTWYLADVDRKIIIADWTEFMMNNYNLDFISSDSNSGWKDYMLLEMYNYGRAYDFYKEIGIYGPDTFGTPMLILTDWTENGAPVKNACSYGNIIGWMCFGASSDYQYEECLDVLTHEFTHGVTSTEMLGNKYSNEAGAINEAFSDIMGEICEHMTLNEDGKPESDDELWYHGGNRPTPNRCMADPNLYNQPGAVGDIFYIVPSQNADGNNDNGGNHFNSSLLNYVAWKLYDEGMPLEDERDLWYTTTCLMTPLSDYDDVLGALLMSVQINKFDEKWAKVIQDTYDEIGLTGDRLENAYAFDRSDAGRVEAQVALSSPEDKISVIYPYSYDKTTEKLTPTYNWMVPDDNGKIYTLLPEGYYGLELLVTNLAGTQGTFYYLQPDGSWGTDSMNMGLIEVEHGNTVDLGTIQ